MKKNRTINCSSVNEKLRKLVDRLILKGSESEMQSMATNLKHELAMLNEAIKNIKEFKKYGNLKENEEVPELLRPVCVYPHELKNKRPKPV